MPAFLNRLFSRFRGFCSTTKAWLMRRLGRWLLALSTLRARTHLRQHRLAPILIDTSLLFHAVTHETAWVSTGPSKWGNIEIHTGYAARIPVHKEGSDEEVFPHIKFLPGIAHLARRGTLKLMTSAELGAEQFRQPTGRFTGYGYDDLNLFEGVNFESVDGHHFDLKDAKQKQLDRVAACQDRLYLDLLGVLGQKNSLDAYHIFTAERHGFHCLLHLDLKLDRLIKRTAKHPVWHKLRTKVILPAAFGAEIKLAPYSPRLLSYEKVVFFTRPNLVVPGEKRRKPARPPESPLFARTPPRAE